ncbi:MAG: YraN family protein [Clostridiales Family XIII bacterium]|jgi:putative endonuclease|nr:YraN family protein [Clostridiales Family XIII bacterium]
MSKKNNKRTGYYGEDIAMNYLISKGYTILERNFLSEYGEIDIIAKEKNTLVFVEVKCRKTNDFGYPLEAVDTKKIKKIIVVLENYLKSKKKSQKNHKNFRIDAIGINLKDSIPVEIKHIENISI